MANPYEVAIHLTAQNGVSGVLAGISKEVLGLEAGVARLQKGFSNLHLGIVGAASALAGAGILKGMDHLVNKGNDWVKVSRDMAQAGASHEQVLRAQAEAMKLTGQYANMSSVEIMKMQNDARMTFGDQDKATEHIKDFVQMASFLKSYEGHEKGSADSESLMREINAAMKSGEIAGKITPEAMHEHIMQLTAMKVAYGEQVKIGTYLAAQRTAGVALRNTSDDFRYGMFPALVQEQGSSAGVMLMTAFNKVVAGVGNRTQSIQEMERIGLLNSDQIKYDKVGRAIGLKDASAMKGSQEAAMNFGSWVMTTLKPLLDKANPEHNPIHEAQLISKMFPDRNAAKAITEVLQQFSKLSKDAQQMAAARKALNMDEYNAGSWDYQVEAFQTQWKNLMTHLGSPMVDGATRMLAGINEVLASMSQWAMNNPETVKGLGAALAAIGAGLAVVGTALVGGAIMAALGPAGWLTAGIAAMAAAVAAVTMAPTASKSMSNSEASQKLKNPLRPFMTDNVNPDDAPAAKQTVQGFFKSIRDGINSMSAQSAFEIGKTIAKSVMDALPAIAMSLGGFALEVAKTIADAVMKVPSLLAGMLGGLAAGVAAAIGKAIKGAVGATTPSGGVGDGGEGMGDNVKKPERHSHYVPPAHSNSNTRTANVYLDGRKVGQIVEDGIGSRHRTISGTNGFDSGADWAPPDYTRVG